MLSNKECEFYHNTHSSAFFNIEKPAQNSQKLKLPGQIFITELQN